jgi:nucleoside-diphosphate-sugar epimerase
MAELKGKRVFVTGADGLISSHIVELPAQRGLTRLALS